MSAAPDAPAPACDIAVLVSYSGHGGVERMINHLVSGLLARDLKVDLLLLKRGGAHFEQVPRAARIRPLRHRSALLAVPELALYLRRERPPVMLAAKDHAGRAALLARGIVRAPTRIFLRIGNDPSHRLATQSRLGRWLHQFPMRRLYPRADGVIAISHGVAEYVVGTTGADPARVHVAPNPVLTGSVDPASLEPPDHPWFRAPGAPVICSAGRLTAQKDYPTLLRAFTLLRRRRAARLLILGEGRERHGLENLARHLGIRQDLELPGHVPDPCRYIASSDLFVLSSAWEGFGNVIVEAMACGTPVVATDCRSGPREILDEGRYGTLVPVGDAQALAEAMEAALDRPPDESTLREAASLYTVQRSTTRYCEILGLDAGLHA